METLRQGQSVSLLGGGCCQEVRERTRGPCEAQAGSGAQMLPPALACTLLQGVAVLSCQLPGAEVTAQEGVAGNTLQQGSRGRQL